MYLNYLKLKPLKFRLDDDELDYFIDLYNNSIKELKIENQNTSWFKKLFKLKNKIDFNKVKNSSKSVEIVNKYMSENNEIKLDKLRFENIKVGRVNEDDYESCLDSTCTIHKLLVIVENTRKFKMDTEVLFCQDDGIVFKKTYNFDAGDAILLKPHNAIRPIYDTDETVDYSESEEHSNSDEEDSDEENEEDAEVNDESEDADNEEADEENETEEAAKGDNGEHTTNVIKYIIIEINDINRKFKIDNAYFY